jgi:hypothetical protein
MSGGSNGPEYQLLNGCLICFCETVRGSQPASKEASLDALAELQSPPPLPVFQVLRRTSDAVCEATFEERGGKDCGWQEGCHHGKIACCQ